MAAIGQCMMDKGVWKGERLMSEKIVELGTLTHSGMEGGNGLAWTVNVNEKGEKGWKTLPIDAFAALGAGHQTLLVVPSKGIICVRYGERLDNDSTVNHALTYSQALSELFLDHLGEALCDTVT